MNFVSIDEDDEDNKPARKMPAMIKPPQNNTRLPPNMENPRPASKPRLPPPTSKEPWNSMAPPTTPHLHRTAGRPAPPLRSTPPSNNYGGVPQQPKGRNPGLSHLKIDSKLNISIILTTNKYI